MTTDDRPALASAPLDALMMDREHDAPTAPLMTAAAAAALLGLGTRTVYAVASAGVLRHYRLGTAVLFAPSDLRAYKEGRKVEARVRTGPADAAPKAPTRPTVSLARREGSGRELRAMFWRAGVESKLSPGAGRHTTKRKGGAG